MKKNIYKIINIDDSLVHKLISHPHKVQFLRVEFLFIVTQVKISYFQSMEHYCPNTTLVSREYAKFSSSSTKRCLKHDLYLTLLWELSFSVTWTISRVYVHEVIVLTDILDDFNTSGIAVRVLHLKNNFL